MAQTGGYREELENELKQTDPTSHASRLVAQEIDRLTKGEDNVEKKEKPQVPTIEIHTDRPQKVNIKIRIPVKEHPRYNFVGKLLGPKGQTLKAMQEQTGCKMAIMGRGSMRDKNKEEELRKEGGKYAHLNEDLHVLLECFADPIEGYHRLAGALVELKKFLVPELMPEDPYGTEMGMGGDMGMNGGGGGGGGGAPRGRGSYRGPPERGGRGGSFRGSGPPSRGAPSSRGAAPPGRGAPRGAPSSRGGPPSMGTRPAPLTSQGGYEGYGAQVGYDGYDTQGYDQGGYNDGYSQSRAQPDTSYYDYSSAGQGGYDSYGGGYDYGDAYAAKPAASQRGAARSAVRPHPYSRPTQGGAGGY